MSALTSSAESADEPAPLRVEAAGAADIPDHAAEIVAGMSLRRKAASVVMGHIATTDADTLRQYMQSTHVGGFILMGANVPGDEDSLRRLTEAMTLDAALPPLISIDQEGGDVSRLAWDGFPGAVTLKGEKPAATRDAFLGRGSLVQRAGIGVNFGIVADVADGGFMRRRALGTSPGRAAGRVAAAVDGEAGQVLSTVKHFPGHGGAAGDSHAGIPTTSMSKSAWRRGEAPPFEAAIQRGVPLLMFGHLRYRAVDKAPASLSATWHRIARDELGFTGVSITDDLGMLEASGLDAYSDPVANAVAALRAGNDMVLSVMFTTPDTAARLTRGIMAAVRAGRLSEERLDEAATRVMALRLRLAAEGRGLTPCDGCEPVRD
ncbi:MAG: glycoside hydrolase family 3 N-terminal domain-containing protein [Microbacterium sp.]|uniref:glycoside hydrolase family 3 N-terminal domain-containing protein n=1 Tax=Microbacterium sp. TaxID=51671 RepID=UPI0039E4F909